MEQKQSELLLEYKLLKDEYIYYNLLYASRMLKKRRDKAFVVGALEILTGIAALLWISSQGVGNTLLYVSVAIILGLGLFSYLFHFFAFPASLKKEADKKYNESKYVSSPMALEFFSNRLEEKCEGDAVTYYWQDMDEIAQCKKLFFIVTKNGKVLIIPKRALADEGKYLDELLKFTADKYKKRYLTWSEPFYR